MTRIVVVGAGLAGLAAARALVERGERDLTVVERRDGPGLETSYANGALLHPSLVEPWNSPGVLRELLRNIGNENAAALLRLRALPSLLGWGARFLRESTADRHWQNTLANLALARHSVGLMAAARGAGIEYGHRPRGSLVLLRDAAALDAATRWLERMAPHGLRSERIGVDALVAVEPALAPIAAGLAGAIRNRDDESGDAHAWCGAVAARLRGDGVRLLYGRRVEAIEAAPSGVRAVRLAGGERLAADAVIVAAASHSVALLRRLGIDLPIRPAKGYSVTVPLCQPGPGDAAAAATRLPRTPVVDPALHVAIVPVGDDRLRAAGTAEFAGFDSRVSPPRVANLMRLLRGIYPEVLARIDPAEATPWTGLRPMTPDGVPLIGLTRIAGLFVNAGHGHLGWTMAAGSGDLLADLLTGRPPAIDPRPYAVARARA